MNILLTGCAGFIGFHCAQRFSSLGYKVVGIDNLNDYYDIRLKRARLEIIKKLPGFSFYHADLAEKTEVLKIFERHDFAVVLHLGAQAGVRYSIENPSAYIESNVSGTLSILEGCRRHNISHLIYASSSSVYGANTKLPFSEDDKTDTPVSLYAATKKSNELMAYSYADLYKIPATGLRFFTVYGPWGRPDMGYFKFANSICAKGTIDVYNYGDMHRDFTYIDDIVDGIEALIKNNVPWQENQAPHRIYNLGQNHPEKLTDMIEIMEDLFETKVTKNFLPMQKGDVRSTFADIRKATHDFSFAPKVDLRKGLEKFAKWYKEYYA